MGSTFTYEKLRAGIDHFARRQIRVHDLWATFVTIKLATGKSEAWIMDRTGHRFSAMI